MQLAATLQEKEKEYDEVISKWNKKLIGSKENMGDDCDKWQSKLYTINEKLERVNTRIHIGKQITRDIIQNHIDELAAQELEMNITIKDLRDENFEMAEEWQDAVDAKLSAEIYTNNLKKAAARDRRTSNNRTKRLSSDAASRLAKWRNKRDARRASEDELARVAREVNILDEVLQRYKSAME